MVVQLRGVNLAVVAVLDQIAIDALFRAIAILRLASLFVDGVGPRPAVLTVSPMLAVADVVSK